MTGFENIGGSPFASSGLAAIEAVVGCGLWRGNRFACSPSCRLGVGGMYLVVKSDELHVKKWLHVQSESRLPERDLADALFVP